MEKRSITQSKGSKMTTESKAPKAVKINEISPLIQNAYSELAGSARDAMEYFVRMSANEISEGRVSYRIGRDSIKEAIKTTGAISDIAPSSFDYMVTASLALNLAGAEKQTIKTILKVSARLHKLIGAEEAQNEVIKAKSWDALIEDIKDSEESLKESKEAEAESEKVDLLANAITLESVIDGLDSYLKAQSLKDLKTTELKKLESVISRLATVAKNSKVA
jgi:hypothetical protein